MKHPHSHLFVAFTLTNLLSFSQQQQNCVPSTNHPEYVVDGDFDVRLSELNWGAFNFELYDVVNDADLGQCGEWAVIYVSLIVSLIRSGVIILTAIHPDESLRWNSSHLVMKRMVEFPSSFC